MYVYVCVDTCMCARACCFAVPWDWCRLFHCLLLLLACAPCTAGEEFLSHFVICDSVP